MFPLCPSHHFFYDKWLLNPEETKTLLSTIGKRVVPIVTEIGHLYPGEDAKARKFAAWINRFTSTYLNAAPLSAD